MATGSPAANTAVVASGGEMARAESESTGGERQSPKWDNLTMGAPDR